MVKLRKNDNTDRCSKSHLVPHRDDRTRNKCTFSGLENLYSPDLQAKIRNRSSLIDDLLSASCWIDVSIQFLFVNPYLVFDRCNCSMISPVKGSWWWTVRNACFLHPGVSCYIPLLTNMLLKLFLWETKE